MQVKTRELQVGTVMASGEVVIDVTRVWRVGTQYRTAMRVSLKKEGRQYARIAHWNINGTVSVNSVPQPK